MGFANKIFRKGSKGEISKDDKIVSNNPDDVSSNDNNNNNNASQVKRSVRINWSSLYKKEDWWAVWIGLTIFALSLPSYAGFYTLGWVPVAKPWLYISHALTAKLFNPWVGLIASFVFLVSTVNTSYTVQWSQVERLVQGLFCNILRELGAYGYFLIMLLSLRLLEAQRSDTLLLCWLE